MDRKENFSIEGRRALFEYLEQLEDDCGEEIEFDCVALCCEYSEYADIQEFIKAFDNSLTTKREDYDDEEEYHEAVKEEIQDNTTLIDIDGESFIIQDY